MPLSTDEFILTHRVTAGVVDTEPVAVAIRFIMEASPCGDDPGWSDVFLENGVEWTFATPFGELVPTSRT